jgi:hypothetical protein
MGLGSKMYFNRKGEIIEVTIRDEFGAKIETRKCKIRDTKAMNHLFSWLSEKYSIIINQSDITKVKLDDWFQDSEDFLDQD